MFNGGALLPRRHDHRLDAHVNGRKIGDIVWIAVHGAADSDATPDQQTDRTVEVVHPAGDGILHGGNDDRRPEQDQRQLVLVVVDDLLGQGLGEDVRVGQEAHVHGRQDIQRFFVKLFRDSDRFLPIGVRRVDLRGKGGLV